MTDFQEKIAGAIGGEISIQKKRWIRGDEHVDPEALKGSKSFFWHPYLRFSLSL